MSERILQALMQLFAILAKVDYSSSDSADTDTLETEQQRKVIEAFLLSELNASLAEKYLRIFDEKFALLNKSKVRKNGDVKKTSLNSVKILRICSEINQELTRFQKKVVLIRILEFVQANEFSSSQITDFVDTVAESFGIEKKLYEKLIQFVGLGFEEKFDDPWVFYVSSNELNLNQAKQVIDPNIDTEFRIVRMETQPFMFLRYYGKDQLFLNGQPVQNDRVHILSSGASVRTTKTKHLYFSDVLSKFISDTIAEKIILKATHLSYRFNGGKIGLQDTSFTAEGGQLIGIMGGSGAGKSTFMNILNGNLAPNTGSVSINGVSVHHEKKKLEGKIGYISQDDLLIEELSVYENLFYNAKLCFKDNNTPKIHKRVLEVLMQVGLYDVKKLKVGNPLDKTISGGQRKRLNIALELIREPAVLFVDEPTSGLSSRDSESIMNLLNELALKGKLIFVVIHQPSSDIFKMFDRLFIMDLGGYMIYDGNPGDAVVYFKLHSNHVSVADRECPECGNVNPEEIFNIIESKVVDELGNLTNTRKNSPQEWYEQYKALPHKELQDVELVELKKTETKPNWKNQFKVYFTRDFLSKISNRQYLLINLLEAPALALFLAFFLKSFGNTASIEYSFYHNDNIPQYLFVSVIVALFLGLAVSAEEIIKDRLLLKREGFLNLSRSSYLFAKIGILFLISAIQSALFLIVGNLLLEIPGLWVKFWFILFTTSAMANMLGLLISSMFKSAKVVYIFIPLVIIPQLLFSGAIVKFNKLHPNLTSEKEVPWIGNSMTSRWAYEALAVTLFLNNPNEKMVFEANVENEESAWKQDYWIPELKRSLATIKNDKSPKIDIQNASNLLISELIKEQNKWDDFKCEDCFDESSLDLTMIEDYISRLSAYYSRVYRNSTAKIETAKHALGAEQFNAINLHYNNESLERLVKNSNELQKMKIWEGELIEKSNPIYRDTKNMRFLDTPLYSPTKSLFGIQFSTYWMNILVIWFFSFFLYFVLYFDLGAKLIKLISSKK